MSIIVRMGSLAWTFPEFMLDGNVNICERNGAER
jgi:hypothetical protein